MELPQILILQIKQVLKVKHFDIRLSENFASKTPGFKTAIRNNLSQDLIDNQIVFQDKEIMDVQKIPNLHGCAISISHTEDIGGYVLVQNIDHIGFDIESTQRNTGAATRRMSLAKEIEQAPDPTSLWVAKEALYKSLLKVKQPKTLADISISQWFPVGEDILLFRGSCSQNSLESQHGIVFSWKCFKMGIFCFLT